MNSSASPRLHWVSRSTTWAIAWVLWFITLTILSSMSQPGPSIDLVGFDKVVHTVFFAIGGTLQALCLAWKSPASPASPPPTPAWKKIALIVIVTGAVVGIVDEWHQTYTPGRTGLDTYDWVADVFGSSLAVFFARPIYHRLSKPATGHASPRQAPG